MKYRKERWSELGRWKVQATFSSARRATTNETRSTPGDCSMFSAAIAIL
jgi:hypothetical protein